VLPAPGVLWEGMVKSEEDRVPAGALDARAASAERCSASAGSATAGSTDSCSEEELEPDAAMPNRCICLMRLSRVGLDILGFAAAVLKVCLVGSGGSGP